MSTATGATTATQGPTTAIALAVCSEAGQEAAGMVATADITGGVIGVAGAAQLFEFPATVQALILVQWHNNTL